MMYHEESMHRICILDNTVYSNQLAVLKIETLSDGSKVYNVALIDEMGQIVMTLSMNSKESALELLQQIEKHSVDTMSLY